MSSPLSQGGDVFLTHWPVTSVPQRVEVSVVPEVSVLLNVPLRVEVSVVPEAFVLLEGFSASFFLCTLQPVCYPALVVHTDPTPISRLVRLRVTGDRCQRRA